MELKAKGLPEGLVLSKNPSEPQKNSEKIGRVILNMSHHHHHHHHRTSKKFKKIEEQEGFDDQGDRTSD